MPSSLGSGYGLGLGRTYVSDGTPHAPKYDEIMVKENHLHRTFSRGGSRLSTQRATKGFSGAESPSLRYLIRRNPPKSLRVAYCRVLGLIAWGLFKIHSKSALWLGLSE
jgi:hypothetical protein